ncbi:MBL fold metallo-hydrolase [Pseudogemmobacter sonorensis]|uniref:MBL fold metallo-hydrolase n=1 Tax=Pseudogemmobacter sonorensis TaxID=2989681 RepID=UPI0036B39013
MAEGEGKAAGEIRRVLAPNASAMTGPGTTTFLLGREEVVVIDPGPADEGHLAAILAAVPRGGRIGAILVTHPHLDHSALTPALARATGAEVMGFGPAESGRSPQMAALAEAGLSGGAEGLDLDFVPDRRLRDGERLRFGDLTLDVLHTPGHMGEHLAFALGDDLFAGDHVMAWAPSLVSPPDGDMAAYMASLARLMRRPWRRLLPCHGAGIDDPAARIAELLAHRRARRAQVLAALRAGPAPLGEVTARVYAGLAPALLPAAARNALAHLIELIEEGEVRASPWPATEAVFRLA